MSNNKTYLWKNVTAVLVGFVVAAVASVVADIGMSSVGLLDFDNFKNSPTRVVVLVVGYRFIFNTIGSFVTARMAPANPMRLVMIGGIIGFVLSIVGAATMWDKAAPWYNLAVIIIALPAAYLGGKLHARTVNPSEL